MQRPEVSTRLACSVNSKKVSIIAAERAVVGNVVCALGSDLISHTLFGHDRSLDFTAGAERSHGKVLRWGSYFSVKNSLDVMGRREERKAARGHLEGVPVFQVRGDGALDQGNSSGVVHGGGGERDNGEADLTGLCPVHEGHKRRRL